MGRSATGALVLSLVFVAGGSPARAGTTSYFCDAIAPPCIESATVNGAGVSFGDPAWSFYVSHTPAGPGESEDVLWYLWTSTSDPELGAESLDDDWVIVFDTGSIIPRVSFIHGTDSSNTRANDGDGTYHITVRATPVIMAGDCDQSVWPWTCPETATQQWDGYLDGQITDYGVWTPVDQRQAMYGMNYTTNVAATSIPPEITNDPTTGVQQLLIRLANPHFLEDGTTVFSGHANLRIPNQFLRLTYGVDDPTTMSSAGLVATGEGGSASASIYQESGDDAMRVDITGMTFSARLVHIRQGVITPRRPTDLRARRTAIHRGRIGFDAATPRGSMITGYRARCESRKGPDVETASADGSPIVVTGLTQGAGYDCRVRALSKAGPGLWSDVVRIPYQVS